jgi:hypothetical protein
MPADVSLGRSAATSDGLEPAGELLSRRERVVFWTAAAAIALSRLLALARSPWDWDEFDFMLALQKYDVRLHHPHPPGSPTYILLARIAHLLVRDEFRSLQTVSTLAAVLLFPAAFLFVRELRFRFAESLAGAALLAFLPNVWFFGGTGFTDITGLTLLLFSLALLLRGRRDRRAYWAGSFLLAFTAGMRPHALLAGVAPGLMATWSRRRRPADVVLAALIGLLVVAVAYGAAARLSGGWGPYKAAVDSMSHYLTVVDSWRNPARPPLGALLDPLFISPYGHRLLAWELSAFAGVSLVNAVLHRRWNVLLVAAVFVPLMVATWLLLDYHSRSRYAMAYGGLQAFLAVDGIAVLAQRLPVTPRLRRAVQAGVVIGLIALSWSWTAPALKTARSTISPTVQALTWVVEHAGQRDQVFVDPSLVPHATYLLSGRAFQVVRSERAARPAPGAPAYFVGEGVRPERDVVQFRRARGALFELARKRYFDVHVLPLHRIPLYLEGWYEVEQAAGDSWRWMRDRGTVSLPSFAGGGRLTLVLGVPLKLLARPPLVTIVADGKLLERLSVGQGTITRSYDLPPSPQPVQLEITTDQVFRPRKVGVNDDDRILGLQLHALAWAPAGQPRAPDDAGRRLAPAPPGSTGSPP